MIATLIAILAGVLLLASAWRNIPGIGPWLERTANVLSPFDVVIGVVALVLGVLQLLSLQGLLLILAGLVLAAASPRSIPSVGASLGRLGDALAAYRLILGAIILLVGLINPGDIIFGLRGLGRL